jgi:hypothetical protein
MMVMLLSFIWMKICYFRLVCSFVFSIYLTEIKSETLSLNSEVLGSIYNSIINVLSLNQNKISFQNILVASNPYIGIKSIYNSLYKSMYIYTRLKNFRMVRR